MKTITAPEALLLIPEIVDEIKSITRPELVARIPDEASGFDYWADLLTPDAWFSSSQALYGFVYTEMRQYIIH